MLFLLFALFSLPAHALGPPEENDFIPPPEWIETHPALPDPEALPRPGETPADVDHRLGPWLDLRGGGQALGSPQGKGPYGTLVSATELPESGNGFLRYRYTDGHFGTGLMISLLENSAADFHRDFPAYTLVVGGIAQEHGGHFPPHKSHQNGLDADILYLGRTEWGSVLDKDGRVTERFETEKNWELWRRLVSQRYAQNGQVDSIVAMILVDPRIKTFLCAWAKDRAVLDDALNREVMRRIRPTEAHDDHFHLRLRCSPYHAQCTGTYAPPAATGCE